MSGQKFDHEKVDLHVLDPLFIEGTARVAQFGESKYGRSNWMNGLTQTRIINAMRRHLAQVEKGEDIDEESGFHHAYHIAWGCQVLAYQHRNGQTELDDRRWSQSVRNNDHHNGAYAGISGHTVPCLHANTYAGLHVINGEEDGLALSCLQSKEDEKSAKSEDPITKSQRMIAEWADNVYPDRTPEHALTKMMMHEIPELLQGGAIDPLEFADVAILLFDVAHLKGIDIGKAIADKMEINRNREWAINPDTGIMSHLRQEDHAEPKNPLKELFGAIGKSTEEIGKLKETYGNPQKPVSHETTEKGAIGSVPPEYPWESRIPEWATKAKISSSVVLQDLPSSAVVRMGHGRLLILIHKNEKKRSHFEKFYCATVKDIDTEEEFNVSWSEIEPWND